MNFSDQFSSCNGNCYQTTDARCHNYDTCHMIAILQSPYHDSGHWRSDNQETPVKHQSGSRLVIFAKEFDPYCHTLQKHKAKGSKSGHVDRVLIHQRVGYWHQGALASSDGQQALKYLHMVNKCIGGSMLISFFPVSLPIIDILDDVKLLNVTLVQF